MDAFQNYIQGKFSPAQSGETLPVINPANDQVYATVSNSDPIDSILAIKSADEAYRNWKQTSTQERSKILFEIARKIENHSEELAYAESIDTGKPISLAQKVDIPRSVENFRFFASTVTALHSDSFSAKNALHVTTRSSLGPVLLITPWNLPLYLLTWKIAPALAMGNTIVAKPSELTPATASYLARITKDLLPPGVLNIVHGQGHKIGESLSTHPRIKAISFTGGTQTGRKIMNNAGPLFKKISLELGGKNPTIVFKSAHLEESVEGALRAAFTNQGQVCLSGSKIFVERQLYTEFRESFLSKMRTLSVGNPQDHQTTMGSLISQSHKDKVLSYLKMAEQEGGKLTQFHKVDSKGAFVAPTLIENLPPQSRLQCEEIFGPVVTLTPFDHEEEILEYAQESPYGLSASIWTNDLNQAHRAANKLEVGMVWINSWMVRDLRTPFGGEKNSGLGREGGRYSLEFFSRPKNVTFYQRDLS